MRRSLTWKPIASDDTEKEGCEQFRIYRYRNLSKRTITQRLNDGYIDLQAFINEILEIRANEVARYIRSFPFMSIVKTFDKKVNLPNIVYLIKINENTFKIGRTHDFIQRYKRSIREKADSVIYVDDEAKVEKELKKAYREAGYVINRGTEYFNYHSFASVKRIFDEVVKEHRVPEPKMESFLIKNEIVHTSITKTYIHIRLLPFLITKYIRDERLAEKVRDFVSLVAGQTKNGYYDVLYDKQLKTKCSTWTYFGIVCIERDSDHNINISRYYNSFLKANGLKKKRKISHFIASKFYRNSIETFNKYHPGEKMSQIAYKNKEQPYFNGTYIHWSLLVAFTAWVNVGHLMDIASILIPMFKREDEETLEMKPVKLKKAYSLISKTLEDYNSFSILDERREGTERFNKFLMKNEIS